MTQMIEKQIKIIAKTTKIDVKLMKIFTKTTAIE